MLATFSDKRGKSMRTLRCSIHRRVYMVSDIRAGYCRADDADIGRENDINIYYCVRRVFFRGSRRDNIPIIWKIRILRIYGCYMKITNRVLCCCEYYYDRYCCCSSSDEDTSTRVIFLLFLYDAKKSVHPCGVYTAKSSRAFTYYIYFANGTKTVCAR